MNLNANQIISLLVCAGGLFVLVMVCRLLTSNKLEDVPFMGQMAIKTFMIGLFIMSTGQLYQAMINNKATLIWLKSALLFMILSGVFMYRAFEGKNKKVLDKTNI